MPPGCRIIAIEPNPYMHGGLLNRAARHGIDVEIRHGIRRPWTWVFEGCSCERDLAAVICAAGFAPVEIDQYRLRSPFLPANTQIAGTAIA